MDWMFFSIIAATCVGWSAIIVATRWAPPSLGWYPQMLIGASVLYMCGSMTYLLVDVLPMQRLMVWVVHLAFALSVFSCWWLLLRVMYMHGHDIGLHRRWTHGARSG